MKRVPLACDLTALDETERARRAALAQRLRDSLRETVELPSGYSFHFTGDPELPSLVEEFVGLERRCCPFLRFVVHPAESTAAVVLELGGDAAVKAFVAEQFGGASRKWDLAD